LLISFVVDQDVDLPITAIAPLKIIGVVDEQNCFVVSDGKFDPNRQLKFDCPQAIQDLKLSFKLRAHKNDTLKEQFSNAFANISEYMERNNKYPPQKSISVSSILDKAEANIRFTHKLFTVSKTFLASNDL
jgi:hypothetical protein